MTFSNTTLGDISVQTFETFNEERRDPSDFPLIEGTIEVDNCANCKFCNQFKANSCYCMETFMMTCNRKI